jgi:glycosyltransferase involved in cell wall biosynthesis
MYEYNQNKPPDHFWLNKNNEIIAIYRHDWGHVFAQDVKKFFPEVAYEVWRMDYRADKEYVHVFEDGVIHRSFPAQINSFREGFKKSVFWTSKELLEKISQYINNSKKDLICHIPVDFSPLSYIILKNFKGRIAFLHTSHLNPKLLKPDIYTVHILKFLHRLRMRHTYHNHLKLLTEIAVPVDRLEFFKRNTRANVYKLNSLNFDFNFANKRISKLKARQKLKLNPESFLIFSSSRLVPEKQIDKMIVSLSKSKDLDFVCIISGAGEVQYEQYLKRLVTDLNLCSKVSFVGFLTDKLIYYYCASDVFITTSGSESGPVSAIKAMALDIPVISTDTGITYYLLKVHKAGLILDRQNSDTWADKIKEVIQGKIPEIIDSNILKREYDHEKSIKQLVGYYRKSLKNWYNNRNLRI